MSGGSCITVSAALLHEAASLTSCDPRRGVPASATSSESCPTILALAEAEASVLDSVWAGERERERDEREGEGRKEMAKEQDEEEVVGGCG